MKRRWKTTIGLLIALMMLLGMIAACSTDSDTGNTGTSDTTAPDTTDSSGDTAGQPADGDDDVIEYRFYSAWGGNFPVGAEYGLVANEVAARTGVRFIPMAPASDEHREAILLAYMSGDMPEIITHWHDGVHVGSFAEVTVEAAMDGMLLELTQFWDEVPTIEYAMTSEFISPTFAKTSLNLSEFGDDRYFLPFRVPPTEGDITDDVFGLWARKDILEAYGKDRHEIVTADDLYDLLVFIKESDIKDAAGNTTIPGSTTGWNSGWGWDWYCNMKWIGSSPTDWYMTDEGLRNRFVTEYIIDGAKFMNKLVNEDLFDVESFTHSLDTFGEKISTGRPGVAWMGFWWHWQHNWDSLYVTNPEMEYVLLGPMKDAVGNDLLPTRSAVWDTGHVVVFSAKTPDPLRLMKALEYLSDDEGFLLFHKGIEGVHWNWEDGIPKDTQEMQGVDRETSVDAYGQVPYFLTLFPRMRGYGWDELYATPQWAQNRADRPHLLYYLEPIHVIDTQWPGYETMMDRIATIDLTEEMMRAVTAPSAKETESLLRSLQDRLIDAGYNEWGDWLTEQYNQDPARFIVGEANFKTK